MCDHWCYLCIRIMRDGDQTFGVFRDPEEFQYYKDMFFNLTDIMSEVGFSDEVRFPPNVQLASASLLS